jgi:hypothetical protein
MTYDELVGGGEEAIASLIGKQESLQLEFKANDARDPLFVDGAITKAGKKILAKEISAFANSAGGVIVFGVDCRVVDKVDQAEQLTPIPGLARAETTVRDAASELLQPRHDGIRVASVPTNEDTNAGYVVVDVPRSDRRPHRSEATDQKQYYKLSGESAFAMEHYDIEDAFKRISSPSLALEVSFERNGTYGSDEHHFKMQFALKNLSGVSAKLISVQFFNFQGALLGQNPFSTSMVKGSMYEGKNHLAAPMDYALHPGENRFFHDFTFIARTTPEGAVVCGTFDLEPGSIHFDYTISAENMRMVSGSYEMNVTDMEPFYAVFDAAKQRKNRSVF